MASVLFLLIVHVQEVGEEAVDLLDVGGLGAGGGRRGDLRAAAAAAAAGGGGERLGMRASGVRVGTGRVIAWAKKRKRKKATDFLLATNPTGHEKLVILVDFLSEKSYLPSFDHQVFSKCHKVKIVATFCILLFIN